MQSNYANLEIIVVDNQSSDDTPTFLKMWAEGHPSRRVQQSGKRAACAEDVFVHHHLSASFNKLGVEKKQALFEKNKAIYEAKWGTWSPHTYRDVWASDMHRKRK